MYMYGRLKSIHGGLCSNFVASSYQATPLHGAAHNGHLHTVQHLVERGADLNIKTVHGVSE